MKSAPDTQGQIRKNPFYLHIFLQQILFESPIRLERLIITGWLANIYSYFPTGSIILIFWPNGPKSDKPAQNLSINHIKTIQWFIFRTWICISMKQCKANINFYHRISSYPYFNIWAKWAKNGPNSHEISTYSFKKIHQVHWLNNIQILNVYGSKMKRGKCFFFVTYLPLPPNFRAQLANVWQGVVWVA